MEFFKANPTIPFMKQRVLAAIVSAIIFVSSLVALAANGLNLGLDFTGGTQAEVTFPQSVTANELRHQLVTAGFDKAVVQAYAQTMGAADAYSVRVAPQKSLTQEQLKEKLLQAMPGAQMTSLEYQTSMEEYLKKI